MAAPFLSFYGCAVSSFYGFGVFEFGLEGSKAKRLECLPPIFKAIKAFKDLKACGGNSIQSGC